LINSKAEQRWTKKVDDEGVWALALDGGVVKPSVPDFQRRIPCGYWNAELNSVGRLMDERGKGHAAPG
jgi:hypothetical protein